jgi:hypothetical protein
MSWLQPAPATTPTEGLTAAWQAADRAHILTRANSAVKNLQINLAGTEVTPIFNPAVIVENWGQDRTATITLNGKKPEPSMDVRQGLVTRANGVSALKALVVWIEHRWSSYGEAVGGGKKGNGKKAREGLVRAYLCDQGVGYEAEKWQEVSRLYRRLMGLEIGRKPGRADVSQSAKGLGQTTKNTAELLESEDNETALKDLGMARCCAAGFVISRRVL